MSGVVAAVVTSARTEKGKKGQTDAFEAFTDANSSAWLYVSFPTMTEMYGFQSTPSWVQNPLNEV